MTLVTLMVTMFYCNSALFVDPKKLSLLVDPILPRAGISKGNQLVCCSDIVNCAIFHFP